jgi:hypothetical protein
MLEHLGIVSAQAIAHLSRTSCRRPSGPAYGRPILSPTPHAPLSQRLSESVTMASERVEIEVFDCEYIYF